MKKIIFIILALSLLLVGCSKNSEISSYISQEKLPLKCFAAGEGVTGVCAFKNIVFMADESGIDRYNVMTDERLRIAELSEIEAVCCDENSVAAYANGALTVYDYNGEKLGEMVFDTPFGSVTAIARNKNSFLIVEPSKNTTGALPDKIYLADIKKNTCKELPSGWNDGERDGSVRDIKFIDENTFGIVFSYNTSVWGGDGKFCAYDIKENKVTEAFEINRYGCYLPEDKKVYCVSTYALSPDSPPFCGIRSQSADGSYGYVLDFDNSVIGADSSQNALLADIVYADGESFVAWSRNRNDIWTVSTPDVEPLVILAPAGDDGTLSSSLNIEEIISDFSDEADIPVRIFTYPEEEYNERLRLKLLAEDKDFDIFFLQGDMLSAVLENNAYEPLDGYDGITESFDGFTDGIRSLMTGKEGIFGIPTQISFYWGNTAECGSDIPMFPSYEDMYSICDSLKGSDKSLLKEVNNVMVIVADFIQDSVSTSGSIDKAELTELLDNMLRLHSDGTLFSKDGRQAVLGNGLNYFTPLIAADPIKDKIYDVVGYPSRSGINYVTVAESLVLNRASSKKEAAASLLRKVASDKYIYNQSIYRGAIIGKDSERNTNFVNGLWSDTDIYYLEKAREILAQSRPKTIDYSSLYRFLLFDVNVLGKMFDGEITADKAADMIIDEVEYTYFE